MDTLSHALWGLGLFGHRPNGRKKFAKTAMFFGAMPDLISFGIFMLQRLFQGNLHFGPPPLGTIPEWLYLNYNIGHSFVICFLVIALVAIKYREFAFAMLAWPFHIVLDFPFHSLKFFPTPIFWPISDYKLDGVPWSHWYIWGPNVMALVLLFFYRAKQKQKNSL